jgi:hypothetical protein
MFQFIINLVHCYGPVVRWSIMAARVYGRAMTARKQTARQRGAQENK